VIGGRRRPADPLDGFTDVTIVGRGSSATVHRAREAMSGQLVAVKVLDRLGDVDRRAFETEARALAHLGRHPNVVTFHRAELTPDGRPLLVLELCEASLADQVAVDGPLPAARVAAIGVALCGALETAHRAGIVHGSVSPSDVLVTRYGDVALADFGLAALRGTDAPGSASTLDVAEDVRGLAVTLVELLTGGARQLPADAAGDLVEVLRRATSSDGSVRFRSALELAQELRAVEVAEGRAPTPCRVDTAAHGWAATPATGTRGRAAATTGLPPLGLRATPLERGRRTPPGQPPARRTPPSAPPPVSGEAGEAAAPRGPGPDADADGPGGGGVDRS
jgi:serine/threonine protein kinase